MEFQPTSIPNVILITPRMFGDQRGIFQETYHREKFRLGGIDVTLVQDNHSRSTRGVLRIPRDCISDSTASGKAGARAAGRDLGRGGGISDETPRPSENGWV